MTAAFRKKTLLHLGLVLIMASGIIVAVTLCGKLEDGESGRDGATPHHSKSIPDGFSIAITFFVQDKPRPNLFLCSASRDNMITGVSYSLWTSIVISRPTYDAARKAAQRCDVPIRNGLWAGQSTDGCLVEFDDSSGKTFHFTVDWHSNSGVACLRSIATALGEKKGILLEPIIRILLSGATPTTEPATDG